MSIYKRKDRNGKVTGWRVVIRLKGYPTVCKECERKEEAIDWKINTVRAIKAGQFQFERHKIQRTFSDLVDHFTQSGALEHHRSAKDTIRLILKALFFIAFAITLPLWLLVLEPAICSSKQH